MVLHLHRAPRTDLLADALGELLSTPLDDPFATELVLVPARGVERWLSQRLSHRLGTSPGAGRRGVRRRRVPVPAVAGRRAHRHPRRGPVGTRRAGLAAAGGARRVARRAVGGDLGAPPRPPRHRRRGRVPARPPLRRRPPAGRPVRVVRRPAAAAARRLVRRPATPTALGSDLDDRPGLAAAALAAPSRPRSARRSRPSGTPQTLERLRGRAVDLPPRHLAVRPHPDAGRPRSSCSRALAAHHDLHLWLPHPSDRPVGAARRPRRGRRRAATTSATAGSGTRCSPRSAATCASCSAASARRDPARTTEVAATPLPGHPARLAPGRPARRRRPAQRPRARRRRPVGPGAPLPRAGPPGRRCSARCCSACSRTTRRLEPRDILVMCPDIENYAPLITAAFGLGDVVDGRPPRPPAPGPARRPGAHPAPTRCSASPRSCSTSPAAAPRPAPCSTSPRARPSGAGSGSPTTTSTRSADWVRESGVRWGFDAEHRAAVRRRATSRTPGGSASTGCSPASRCPTTPRPGSAPRCRSTTSAATGSSSPAGSPSTSTGWSPPPTG